MCSDFLRKFCVKISHSKENSARYFRKCAMVCMQSTGCYCRILMKLEFYGQIFNIYTGCPTSQGHYFGRVFLMLKYTDITHNTYVQS